MTRSALIAVGGNSLIGVGQRGTIEEQLANAQNTARKITQLVADGWRIVDYKTDRVEGSIAELLERHGLQLGSYVNAWHVVTGEAPARAGIFGVRDVKIAWSAATPAAGS